MPAPRDPSTLLAAARLYYLENRSQAEIARELGTSRSNVSRMLTEAQRQGIVTVTINDPSGRMTELENDLRARFGLVEVRVAQRGPALSVRVDASTAPERPRPVIPPLVEEASIRTPWMFSSLTSPFCVLSRMFKPAGMRTSYRIESRRRPNPPPRS